MFCFDALSLPAYQPPSELPKGAEVRSKFGQACLWWPREHGGYSLSKEELEPYRLLGDGPVDRILQLLEKEGRPLGPKDDLLALAEAAQQKELPRTPAEQSMCTFLSTHQRQPSWVDVEQLKRGQEVYLAYTPVASLSLYYRSLVAGFSIPKIAAVVRSTAYLTPPSRPDQVLQRLFDTGALNASCIGLGVESLLPGGEGWRTALHVRVLHAKVRYQLLRKRKQSNAWDVHCYGVPINQEDMAATLLAFSTNVLFGIDFVSGSSLTTEERLDYLAFWRYVGWLLGVETQDNPSRPFERRDEQDVILSQLPPLDPCGPGYADTSKPDPVQNSNSLLQSFIFHLLDPDESSVDVAHHLLKVTDRRPPHTNFHKIPDSFYRNDLFYFRALQCRRFIGDPLADALDLPLHPDFWKRVQLRIKSTFFLTLLRIYTLSAMHVPFLRRRIISWHRGQLKAFHDIWKASHKSKMARAFAKREMPGWTAHNFSRAQGKDNNDDDPFDESEENRNTVETLCPFAMVASPV